MVTQSYAGSFLAPQPVEKILYAQCYFIKSCNDISEALGSSNFCSGGLFLKFNCYNDYSKFVKVQPWNV